MSELIEVDQEGSATLLASSSELQQLWEEPGDAPPLQAVHEEPDGRREGSDELLPETARAGLSPDGNRLNANIRKVDELYRRKLASRSLRVRLAVAAAAVVWFFAVEFIYISRTYAPAQHSAPIALARRVGRTEAEPCGKQSGIGEQREEQRKGSVIASATLWSEQLRCRGP